MAKPQRDPRLASVSDIDLIEALACEESRESFWAFRQFMNPKMKLGWWQRDCSLHLQQFYEDMVAKLRPKLVIQAPPQHGKSDEVVDFIAWALGKNPDLKTIYASFSGRLGKRANKKLQRMMTTRKYRLVFPDTRPSVTGDKTDDGTVSRTQELIELVGKEGSFRNTTVLGSVTGETLDLGVIDDPLKGRAQANSETIRDNVWEWFTDDFFTRFDDAAGLLIILTRWHVDDPVGRMQSTKDGPAVFPDLKILAYPAIAVVDDAHRKAGEPLFPEHKSIDFLLERKRALGTSHFESLYQQNPIILGGNIIRGEWLRRVAMAPKIVYRKIYADTAMKTAERNDYSVFECWGFTDEGKIILLDLIRGKWEAPDLKRRAIEFWNKHNAPAITQLQGKLREMVVEDKASGTGLIQDLKRAEPGRAAIPIKGVERTKDKLTRVQDVLSFIEAGFVQLLADSPFVSDFVSECEAFKNDDSHDFDDQIDPMCDAIEDMLRKTGSHLFGNKR